MCFPSLSPIVLRALGNYAECVLVGLGTKNPLPAEHDNRALKSKDSMIAIHRRHQGNGKPR